ncbi:MAG: hypothetical protein WDA27_00805 [Actinomycetota bacterium]
MTVEDEIPPQDLTSSPPSAPPQGGAARALLTLALILSLTANGILVFRLLEAESSATKEQKRSGVLADELEAARKALRAGARPDNPIDAIATAVSRLRGLAFKTSVIPEVLTPAKFKQRVAEQFRKDADAEEFAATGKVLKVMGLLAPQADLFAMVERLQAEQVVGFYDNKTKKLVVSATGTGALSPLDRALLAHELTHALTDQHFDLGRLDELQDTQKDDEAMAYLALAEGDATLTMRLYQEQILTEEERRRLSEEARGLSQDVLDAAPKYLQYALEFPYVRGFDFVKGMYDRGGFELVDQAYGDPPVSSEQILHPGKYLDTRDAPVSVRMPDVRGAMGAGWRTLQDGGMGEFDVRALVDYGGAGLSLSDAIDASSGWDGGRYVGIEGEDGVLVASLTAWDSVGRARESTRILGRWLPMRFRNQGKAFEVGGDGRGWSAKNGAAVVLRNGDRVLLLIGPSIDAVKRARTSFDGF